MTDVPAHLQRVIDERSELVDRLTKLKAFFGNPTFSSLPADEQERMRRQASVMHDYADVLAERLIAADVSVEPTPTPTEPDDDVQSGGGPVTPPKKPR